MKYFPSDLTPDQVKELYFRLCRKFHPDLHMGDNSQDWNGIMKQVNAEYAKASDAANRRAEPARRKANADKYNKEYKAPTEQDFADLSKVDEKIREAIYKIVPFQRLNIEICYKWVWVSGTTSRKDGDAENTAALDAMMAAGYHWKSNKKMWAFEGIPASPHHKPWTMEQIREYHGSVKVNNKSQRVSASKEETK